MCLPNFAAEERRHDVCRTSLVITLHHDQPGGDVLHVVIAAHRPDPALPMSEPKMTKYKVVVTADGTIVCPQIIRMIRPYSRITNRL